MKEIRKMIKNFLKSMKIMFITYKNSYKLKASNSIINARMNECNKCDKLLKEKTGNRCSICGCFVKAKTKLTYEKCPDIPAKWDSIEIKR